MSEKSDAHLRLVAIELDVASRADPSFGGARNLAFKRRVAKRFLEIMCEIVVYVRDTSDDELCSKDRP